MTVRPIRSAGCKPQPSPWWLTTNSRCCPTFLSLTGNSTPRSPQGMHTGRDAGSEPGTKTIPIVQSTKHTASWTRTKRKPSKPSWLLKADLRPRSKAESKRNSPPSTLTSPPCKSVPTACGLGLQNEPLALPKTSTTDSSLQPTRERTPSTYRKTCTRPLQKPSTNSAPKAITPNMSSGSNPKGSQIQKEISTTPRFLTTTPLYQQGKHRPIISEETMQNSTI